jgi:uncharacterized protein (DUF1778 family)
MPSRETKTKNTTRLNSASGVRPKHHDRKLSNTDRDAFLAILDNPPEPNKALRKAAKNYLKRILE